MVQTFICSSTNGDQLNCGIQDLKTEDMISFRVKSDESEEILGFVTWMNR